MTSTHDSKSNPALAIEVQIGLFRVAGRDPTATLATLQRWISFENRPLNFFHPERIHLILDESVPDLGVLPDSNSTLILDLENIELVRLSYHHYGSIRWYCQRDPRSLVGPLLDHYRGTYYQKTLNQIAYCSGLDLEHYHLAPGAEVTKALLAAVCLGREAGIRAETIQTGLLETNKVSPFSFLHSKSNEIQPRQFK